MLENSNVREMSFLDHLAYKVIYQHETSRDISLKEGIKTEREIEREIILYEE